MSTKSPAVAGFTARIRRPRASARTLAPEVRPVCLLSLRCQALIAVAWTALLCGVLVSTSHDTAWWALFLTLCQVVAMQACCRDLRWGWAFALTLQAPWAIYDVLTHQLPFLITSVLCAVAQVTALRRIALARDQARLGAPNPPGTPSPTSEKES